MIGGLLKKFFGEDISSMYELVINPKDPNDQCYCVKITRGIYKDAVVKYGRVKFSPPDPVTGQVVLDFNYEVIQTGGAVDVTALSGVHLSSFNNFLGDLMMEIISKDIEQRSQGELIPEPKIKKEV